MSRDGGETVLVAEKRNKQNKDYGKVNRLDMQEAFEICFFMSPAQTKQKSDTQFCRYADKQYLLCLDRKLIRN